MTTSNAGATGGAGSGGVANIGGNAAANAYDLTGGAGGGTASTAGGISYYGGGGGGGSGLNNAVGAAGGGSWYGGGGGGGGGTSNQGTTVAGGAGGASMCNGTGGGGAANGGNGSTVAGWGGSGGGGGNSVNNGVSGNGGVGAAYGGGGGGGGGSNGGTGGRGGSGGNGGAGAIKTYVIRGDDSAADLAEIYSTNDPTLEAGDVVALDPALKAGVRKTDSPYDPMAIGIVSTKPDLIIGFNEDPGSHSTIVALAGRVPVKVSMENGPIKIGDLLTASSVPGVAMKATKAGQIVGQAMAWYDERSVWDGSSVGTIAAFLKPSFYGGAGLAGLLPDLTVDATADPNVQPSDGSVPTQVADKGKRALHYFLDAQQGQVPDDPRNRLSEIVTDRVLAGVEVVTPRLVAHEVLTDTISSATGADIGMTLAADGKFVIRGPTPATTDPAMLGDPTAVTGPPQTQDAITFDGAGNAVFLGEIKAKSITADKISGIEVFTDKISALTNGLNELGTQTDAVAQTATDVQADVTQALADLQGTQQTFSVRVDQLAGLVANLAALTEQVRLSTEGFAAADAAFTAKGEETDARLTDFATRLTALEALPAVDLLHLDGVETLSVSGLATFAGGLKVDRIASLGDLTLFENDVQFIGRPYFDHDSGGFAVIPKGMQGIRVTFDRAYVAQPVVNAMISLETPDPEDGITAAEAQATLDAKAREIFGSDVRFLITDKNREGFTILLNKGAPFDLRFSWIALAVKDAKTFLVAPDETVPTEPEPPPLNWPTSDPATQAWEQTVAPAADPAATTDGQTAPAEAPTEPTPAPDTPEPALVPAEEGASAASEPAPAEAPTEPTPAPDAPLTP